MQEKKAKQNSELLSRITLNPKVLVGKPTIRGMRISVEHVLHLLAEGMSHREILDEFPMLEDKDIRAALLYAHNAMANEKVYTVRAA